MVVADHVQGVVRTNFLASWDEIGEDHEMQDTFALSSMTSLEGMESFNLTFLFQVTLSAKILKGRNRL